MKWDDIDAQVILDHVREMQPEAPEVLESDPQMVLNAFINTLPEKNYAGVSREHCNPQFCTLEEYFEEKIKKGKYPVKKGHKRKERNNEQEEEEEEEEWEDVASRNTNKVITCSICKGRTKEYLEGETFGLHHFAYVHGVRYVVLKVSQD